MDWPAITAIVIGTVVLLLLIWGVYYFGPDFIRYRKIRRM